MAAQAGGLDPREARRATGVRIVTPTTSVRKRIREIWLSRELLVYLVRTEIKVKYKNSVLGLVWSMVAPAMTLAIYFVVFQIVLANHTPNFVIFLFAGLLLWNLFSLGVLTGTGVVVNNSGHREEGLLPTRDPLAGRRRLGLRLLLLPVDCDGPLHDRPAPRAGLVLLAGPAARSGDRHRARLGHCSASLCRQRLPARHAAPHRGHPHRMVLGLSDRLRSTRSRSGPGSGRRA